MICDGIEVLIEEIAFEYDRGCKAEDIWNVLEFRKGLEDELLVAKGHIHETYSRIPIMDDDIKFYYWEHLKRVPSIIFFYKPKKIAQGRSDICVDNLETEILESLKKNNYDLLDADVISPLTWENACHMNVLLISSRELREKLVYSPSNVLLNKCDSAWLLIKEISKSKSNGLTQLELAADLKFDSRALYHYKKILGLTKVIVFVPIMIKNQYTTLWIHSNYAVYNQNYRSFAKLDLRINLNIEDPNLPELTDQDHSILVRETQYTNPIENVIRNILSKAVNKMMLKKDLLKILRLVYNNYTLKRLNFSKIIKILEKKNLLSIAALPENNIVYNYNQVLLKLSDTPNVDQNVQKFILNDLSLKSQITRLIIESGEKGITSVEIYSHFPGVWSKTIDSILPPLTNKEPTPTCPYILYRATENIGKERMYLYSARKFDIKKNNAKLLKQREVEKGSQTRDGGYLTGATIAAKNRRKKFLEIVEQRKFIDRSEILCLLQNSTNEQNASRKFNIDRKTLNRDAVILTGTGQIQKYTAAIPTLSGKPIIRFIYLSKEVDINQDDFKNYLKMLERRPTTTPKKIPSLKSADQKDLRFDDFNSWMSRNYPDYEFEDRNLSDNSKSESDCTSEAGVDNTEKYIKKYQFIHGKMLRAKYLHFLIFENIVLKNLSGESELRFRVYDAMNFLKLKDILSLSQVKKSTVRNIISKVHDIEGDNILATTANQEKVLETAAEAKLRLILKQLLLILESLHLIKCIESSVGTLETREDDESSGNVLNLDSLHLLYQINTNVPLIDILAEKRKVIEFMDIYTLKDFEYYWTKLEIVCTRKSNAYERPLFIMQSIDPLPSEYKYISSWPHKPGIILSKWGKPVCIAWRRIHWSFSKNMSTEKTEFKGKVKDIVAEELQKDTLYSLNSPVPEGLFVFKNDNGYEWTRKENEDLIYSISISKTMLDISKDKKYILVLASLFGINFQSSREAFDVIQDEVAQSLKNVEFVNYVNTLSNIYYSIKHDKPEKLGIQDLYQESVVMEEVKLLRNFHLGIFYFGNVPNKRSIHDLQGGNVEIFNSAVVLSGITGKPQKEWSKFSSMRQRMKYSYQTKLQLDLCSESYNDEFESFILNVFEYFPDFFGSDAEANIFCICAILRLTASMPSSGYNPLYTYIPLSNYPKMIIDIALRYLCVRKTLLKVRSRNNNTSLIMGFAPSEGFVTAINNGANKLFFKSTEEVCKKHMELWNSASKKSHEFRLSESITCGEVAVLMDQMATGRVSVRASFPDNALDSLSVGSKGKFYLVNPSLQISFEENSDLIIDDKPDNKYKRKFDHKDFFSPEDHIKTSKRAKSLKNDTGDINLNEVEDHNPSSTDRLKYSNATDAINSLNLSCRRRYILDLILDVLEKAGSNGSKESEIFSKICDIDDSIKCESYDVKSLLEISQKVFFGDPRRSLVVRSGLSCVCYILHKFFTSGCIMLPSASAWAEIIKSQVGDADKDNNEFEFSSIKTNFYCEKQPLNEIFSKSSYAPARIWTGIDGKKVDEIWKSLCKLVISIIVQIPGISEAKLFSKVSMLMSRVELCEILEYLIQGKFCKRRCTAKCSHPEDLIDCIFQSERFSFYKEIDEFEINKFKTTHYWPLPYWYLLCNETYG